MAAASALLDPAGWRRLRLLAQRLSRSRADAEDLLHDTLLAAMAASRFDPAWVRGVMVRQAALAARGAVRRRRREQQAGEHAVAQAPDGPGAMAATGVSAAAGFAALLGRLPPAQRRTAILAAGGLGPAALRWVLGIGPAALRQRVCALRRGVAGWSDAERALWRQWPGQVRAGRDPRLPAGRIRQSVRAAQQVVPALGTHDPDGHPLLIGRRAHARAVRGN